MFLKQSTAATIALGPFVDDTDGKTAETGLTISQADVRLSKNGAAFAQKSDTGAATHMENGYYSCALNTTDTGTLGRLRVAVNEAGALPVWVDFMVVPANVWDSLFGADKLQVHVDEMTAGIITEATLATDALAASKIKADAVTKIQTGLATSSAQSTAQSSLTSIIAYVDELEARLTAARAGYLDALNTGVPLSAAAVDAVHDEVVEGSLTMRQALRLVLAVLTGKSAGGGTSTITFRDLADTKNRISATVDANRNRTAVTRDGS